MELITLRIALDSERSPLHNYYPFPIRLIYLGEGWHPRLQSYVYKWNIWVL
jgi:hypothetical protein